jgi:hypothetical protein
MTPYERKTKAMKKASSALLMMLALATSLPSIAQPLKPNELPLNLPGATTIAAPSEGFDPLAASDEDLAYHGFPPRPDAFAAPDAFASWTKAVSASKTRIVPHLEQASIARSLTGPSTSLSAPAPGSNGLTSSTWTGYLNPSGGSTYGSNSFYYIYADLIVPAASQGPGVCTGGWVDGISWVGIDGYQSSDVLQAGVEFDAYCKGSITSSYYSPWYEWFPNAEVRITNLPIAPGDPYFVEVWHTSPAQGYAYFVNEDTEQAVEVGFTAPAGVKLVGSSAEWILESRTVTEILWNAYAVTFAGSVVDPGSASSEPISIPLVAGPSLLGSSAFVAH